MYRTLASVALAGIVVAHPALAQTPLLVTNPGQMCNLPADAYSGELGMTLEPGMMSEIEYHCQWDQPLTFDWSQYRAVTRVGYCQEPGFIMPSIFVFEMSDSEPGIVTVWERDRESPTVFHACP